MRRCPCGCGRYIGRYRVAREAVDIEVAYPILQYGIDTRDAPTARVLSDVLADARRMTAAMLAYAHAEPSASVPKTRTTRFVKAIVGHAVFDIAHHDGVFVAKYAQGLPESQRLLVRPMVTKQTRIPNPPRR